MLRFAIGISGSGTTARYVIDQCGPDGILHKIAECAFAFASRPCDGIQRCIEGGMKPEDVLMLRKRDFTTAEEHAQAQLRELHQRGVNLVGLYGYTTLMHPMVIEAFSDMMVNQHPGPLDPPRLDFGGQGMVGQVVHECVLAFAEATGWQFTHTEATAHRVTEEYDKGMVVGRRPLPLRQDHSPDTLAQELLPIEWELQAAVVGQFALRRVKEFTRDTPLIQPKWEQILRDIKKRVVVAHQ